MAKKKKSRELKEENERINRNTKNYFQERDRAKKDRIKYAGVKE